MLWVRKLIPRIHVKELFADYLINVDLEKGVGNDFCYILISRKRGVIAYQRFRLKTHRCSMSHTGTTHGNKADVHPLMGDEIKQNEPRKGALFDVSKEQKINRQR